MAMSKYITEPQLMEMAGKVAPEDMKQIGVLYLGLEMPEIKIFVAQNRDEVIMTNFAILESWRNKHDGPDAPERLYKLLSKAAEKQLIEPKVFQFLKQGSQQDRELDRLSSMSIDDGIKTTSKLESRNKSQAEASQSVSEKPIGSDVTLVTVQETTLLNSIITVCGNVTEEQVIWSMAISAAGQVVYSKDRKDAPGIEFYSLHVVENGAVKTVIPEITDGIGGLTFIQIAGREQLLVNRKPHIQLMSPDLQRVERKLVKLEHFTPLCRSREGKALHVQRTGVEGEWEVRDLEVMPDKCHYTLKATLRLGWEYVDDMCKAGGLLVLCSSEDNSVAGVSHSDWQVKWKVSVKCPGSVCPGTPGSVFVVCSIPLPDTIHQLSLQDGSVLTQIPLGSGVLLPNCVCNHHNILYVAHWDAEVAKTKKQIELKISQYQFK